MIALLPNSTHLLQPLDVAVFRPVKGAWRQTVREFRINNNYDKLKRTDFAQEVQKCFNKCIKPETIKNGFRCCGLFPFDPELINYTKLLSKPPQIKEIETNSTLLGNPQPSVSNEGNKDFKQMFEDRLPSETLLAFKDAHNEWKGDPTYEKLFEFWKNLNKDKQSDETSFLLELGDTTLANNLAQENGSKIVLNLDDSNCEILDLAGYDIVFDPSRNNTENVMYKSLTDLESRDTTQTPVLVEIINQDIHDVSKNVTVSPFSLVVSPPPVLMKDKRSYRDLRTSTPQSEKTPNSPQLSVSECDNSDSSNIFSAGMETPQKNRSTFNDDTAKDNFARLPAILESKELSGLHDECQMSLGTDANVLTKPCKDVPTPFKQISTPFKKAFYFPKKNVAPAKRVLKKVTPTVATSKEFMDHQRKVEKEKEEAEQLKIQRKRLKLERKEEKENKQKKKNTVNDKKKSIEHSQLKTRKLSNLTTIKTRVFVTSDSDSDTEILPRSVIKSVDMVRSRMLFSSDSDD